MDGLSGLGFGFEMQYPLMYGPESYGRWQIQNYINDKLSDEEKVGLLTQILGSIQSEKAKHSFEEAFEKFKGKTDLQ